MGVEAVLRASAPTGTALAADGAPVEDDEVAGRDLADALADRLHDARGLVPQQEGELVVDPALAVVQIGVAHAAGLDPHHHLARPGVGHDDRRHLHGRALGACDDCLDLLGHPVLLRRPVPLCTGVTCVDASRTTRPRSLAPVTARGRGTPLVIRLTGRPGAPTATPATLRRPSEGRSGA